MVFFTVLLFPQLFFYFTIIFYSLIIPFILKDFPFNCRIVLKARNTGGLEAIKVSLFTFHYLGQRRYSCLQVLKNSVHWYFYSTYSSTHLKYLRKHLTKIFIRLYYWIFFSFFSLLESFFKVWNYLKIESLVFLDTWNFSTPPRLLELYRCIARLLYYIKGFAHIVRF